MLQILRDGRAVGRQIAVEARLVLFIELRDLGIGGWFQLVGDLGAHDFVRADVAFVGFIDQKQIVDAAIERPLPGCINLVFHFENVGLHALVDRFDADGFAVDGSQHRARRRIRRVNVRVPDHGVRHLQPVHQSGIQLFAFLRAQIID